MNKLLFVCLLVFYSSLVLGQEFDDSSENEISENESEDAQDAPQERVERQTGNEHKRRPDRGQGQGHHQNDGHNHKAEEDRSQDLKRQEIKTNEIQPEILRPVEDRQPGNEQVAPEKKDRDQVQTGLNDDLKFEDKTRNEGGQDEVAGPYKPCSYYEKLEKEMAKELLDELKAQSGGKTIPFPVFREKVAEKRKLKGYMTGKVGPPCIPTFRPSNGYLYFFWYEHFRPSLTRRFQEESARSESKNPKKLFKSLKKFTKFFGGN